MAIALNPDKEQLYILEEDRELPEEEQTRWFIRTLNAVQYYRAQDNVIELHATGRANDRETKTRILSGTQEMNALIDGIAGVENFKDEHGVDQNWPDRPNDAKRTFLSKLRPRWRRELAQAILGDSEVDEDDRKKLPSPPESA
jgi:hypothetical protein